MIRIAGKSWQFLGVALLLGLSGLSGCAKVNELGLGLVTTKVDAFAIVNGQLIAGTVFLVPDRSGRVVLASERGPITACGGAMRYTGSVSGMMTLHCSDGSEGNLRFSLMSESRGFAYGTTATAAISLVFGVPEEEAPAYLQVPAGHKLGIRDPDIGLELQ